MRTDLWAQFGDLIDGPPLVLATVTAHNPDGTSSLAGYDGSQFRALGQLGMDIPYNVWVRNGRVVEAAPNLELVEVTV